MKQFIFSLAMLFISMLTSAQQKKYLGVLLSNTQTEVPFGKFMGMFRDAFHPGIEFTYGNNFSMKKKHDWFLEYKIGYFFHRYVQHGIPLYANLGYRYHVGKSFSIETGLGAGAMVSVPASPVYILDVEGYRKVKGKQREQLIATYGIGLSYSINPAASHPVKIVTNYQQRIQFPFVKSYVPLLPYNSFMVGISKSIGKNKLRNTSKVSKYSTPVDRLFMPKKQKN